MSDQRAPDWDPRDPSVLEDQRDAYDRMRETCPIAFSEFLGWSVFRHSDVAAVVDDSGAFSSASRHRAIPNGIDPPEHGKYRALIERYFTADVISTFEPDCRSIAGDLIDPLVGNTGVDAIEAFATPLPLRTTCRFLGWPDSRWEHLRGWTHGNQLASFARDREAGAALAREFTGYVIDELAERRSDHVQENDDLTARLMREEIDGRSLYDEEIVSILRNWVAGQGTVASGIGLLIWHLASDQGLQRDLRASPDLLPTAVDEILRVDGPLVSNRRTATRDLTIGGCPVPNGAQLTLMWIAANRDPRVFDNPDAVDLTRDEADNLLFGRGIHDCVGAPLARMEMRVALEELLGRTRSIEIAPSDNVERAVYPGNGIRRLPVTFR